MKLEDLGVDVKTGYHNKLLTGAETAFVGILWGDHVGRDRKVSAGRLAQAYAWKYAGEYMLWDAQLAHWKREVRYMHNHLLKDHAHIPILSKAGTDGGYWIAESETEAAEFYESFRKRGLTGLVKASRGKQSVMVDMVTQLTFEFGELADKTEYTGLIRRRADLPTPIEVVDSFLGRMLEEPERFADGLRKIGRKYGSVLLPKAHVAAIQSKAGELQELIKGLA